MRTAAPPEKKRSVVKRRRTQEERRTETIRKLIGATIDALLVVGYARTTAKEICRRAKLTTGALFRFFPTVLALVLAAAEEVARRQISEFGERFATLPEGSDAIGAALGLLRDACRSPTNTVFHELVSASRTDRVLRKALAPGVRRYNDAIRASARSVHGVEALSPELLDALLFAAIHIFDGEARMRLLVPQPDIEETRLELLRVGITRALDLGRLE